MKDIALQFSLFHPANSRENSSFAETNVKKGRLGELFQPLLQMLQVLNIF